MTKGNLQPVKSPGAGDAAGALAGPPIGASILTTAAIMTLEGLIKSLWFQRTRQGS